MNAMKHVDIVKEAFASKRATPTPEHEAYSKQLEAGRTQIDRAMPSNTFEMDAGEFLWECLMFEAALGLLGIIGKGESLAIKSSGRFIKVAESAATKIPAATARLTEGISELAANTSRRFITGVDEALATVDETISSVSRSLGGHEFAWGGDDAMPTAFERQLAKDSIQVTEFNMARQSAASRQAVLSASKTSKVSTYDRLSEVLDLNTVQVSKLDPKLLKKLKALPQTTGAPGHAEKCLEIALEYPTKTKCKKSLFK